MKQRSIDNIQSRHRRLTKLITRLTKVRRIVDGRCDNNVAQKRISINVFQIVDIDSRNGNDKSVMFGIFGFHVNDIV